MDKKQHRRVLITGAASGLGRAVAEQLVQAGWTVYGVDRAPIRICGVRALRVDLTDGEAVRRAANYLPPLDAVVHLAGIYGMDSFLEIEETELKRVLDVNLLGVYRVNQAVMPRMRPGGRVVITTSEMATEPAIPFTGVYSLSKCALDHYAHALRCEAGLLGLTVVTVRPGAYDTGLIDASRRAMERMAAKTRLYPTNIPVFRKIMASQSHGRPPAEFARLIRHILETPTPHMIYRPHQSAAMNALRLIPARAQVLAYRALLRPHLSSPKEGVPCLPSQNSVKNGSTVNSVSASTGRPTKTKGVRSCC